MPNTEVSFYSTNLYKRYWRGGAFNIQQQSIGTRRNRNSGHFFRRVCSWLADFSLISSPGSSVTPVTLRLSNTENLYIVIHQLRIAPVSVIASCLLDSTIITPKLTSAGRIQTAACIFRAVSDLQAYGGQYWVYSSSVTVGGGSGCIHPQARTVQY